MRIVKVNTQVYSSTLDNAERSTPCPVPFNLGNVTLIPTDSRVDPTAGLHSLEKRHVIALSGNQTAILSTSNPTALTRRLKRVYVIFKN